MVVISEFRLWQDLVRPEWWSRPSGVRWGYWKLDWNMDDSSWCGHNGSGNSNYVTWHIDWTQAYNASSTSYNVNVANSSDLYMGSWEKFSFWFWIKPNYSISTGATYWVISMTRNIDSYTWRSIHNDSNSRNRQLRLRWSGWALTQQLTWLSWSSGERFHFVITYDGSTFRYYKNSVQVGSFTWSTGDCATGYPLTIWYASTWNAYGNAVYQEAFYMKNYCLTQDEITKIYAYT